MASGTNRDVNLVIRAKDEASRAFEQATSVLEQLVGINRNVGTSAAGAGVELAKLGEIAVTLDRVFGAVGNAANRASASFERQQASIAKQRSQLAGLQAEAQSAAAAIDRLNSAEAIVDAGRDQSGRLAQLQAATVAYEKLELSIQKLKGTIATAETALASQGSSLQQIGSTANALEDARNRTTAAIERETAALREQQRAASTVVAIERSTGLDRDRTEYEALTAQIRATAEARDIEIAKMRAEEDASASLSRAKQTQRDLNRALAAGTGGVQIDDRPVYSAKDSAAFFQKEEADGYQRLAKAIDIATKAANDEAIAVAKLKAEVDPLGTAQAKLNVDLAAAKALYDRGAIGASEYAAKVDRLNTAFNTLKANSSKLDAKEVQNLQKALGDALRAASDEADEIARLKGELAPLAAAEANAAAQAEKLKKWFDAGRISAKEYDGAIKVLQADLTRLKNAQGGIDTRGRPSLFGLKPYEAQNLSFQINDIVTQLASGASLSQTLAQQSGQIIQLFPRVGSAILSAFKSGPIIAFVATLGTVVAAVARAADQAERLRKFEGILLASADGANRSAEALVKAQNALDQYGLSAEQALAVVRTLFKEGFDDSRIAALGKTSKDLADVLGIDVKDAAKQVADAFNGSYEEVRKLDDAMNFLSAAERQRTKELFESGKAEEGRTYALGIFSGKMDEAAGKMRGSWSEATRNLSNAWTDFLNVLADTGIIDGLATALDKLGRGVSDLISRLRGARQLANIDSDIQDVRDRIETRRTANPVRGFLIDSFGNTNQAKDEAELNRLLGERQQLIAGMGAEQSKNNGKNRELTELQKKQNADLLSQTNRLRAQGDQLSANQRLQLVYNEALMEAQRLYPNASAELQRNYALTAQKTEQLRLSKAAAQAAQTAAAAAERERRERERQAKDPVFQSAKLIKQFEGYKSKAYWDVNAFRNGYGSDTMTAADGRVSRVTRNSVTDRAGADRDLERRIAEFMKVVTEQIGSDRFKSFGAEQQAALTSIAYNYGRLPDRIIEAVKSGTTEDIKAAVLGLAGDNGGVNRKRREREAGILGNPNLAVEADTQRQLDEIKKKQDEYVAKVDEATSARELENTFLEKQKGLQGEALQVELRRQFVAQEVVKAQLEADKLDIARDNPEWMELIKRVEAAAGAYYDLANAKEAAQIKTDAVEKPIANLQAQADGIREQMSFLREAGLTAEANELQPALDAVNAKLTTAIDKAIAFYQALDPATDPLGRTKEEIDLVILGLNNAKLKTQEFGTVLGVSGQQIRQAFASSATSAFMKFTQAIANGENVFSSLKDSFLDFASSFLQAIAQMIIQMLALQAITMIMKALGVPIPTGAKVAHTGGVIGQTGLPTRNLPGAIFASAVRYHTGGVVGLRPDEVPAVLQRGEEVLTADDPRHRNNGGMGGSAPQPINVINAIDAGDFVSKGLGTAHGEKAVLNWMRANSGAVKSALG